MSAQSPVAGRRGELLHDAHRALEQVIAVERQYLDRNPYRLDHRYDPRAARYTIRIHVVEALPTELAALVAQLLRAARASLDALATALASSTGAAEAARAIRFPIHESLPEFAQRSRRAMATMPDEVQATIEELQPYHTFGGFQKDALWLLRELEVADPPALAAGALREDSELGVNTRRHVDVVDELRVQAGAFEDGAVVADVAATVVGRDPKLDLYLRPSFQLAFAAQGPTRGAALVPTLTAICERVEAVRLALRG